MELKALQDFEFHSKVPEEIIEKYEGKIPEQFIELWEKYGFGLFMQGYFKVINPDDYIEFVRESNEATFKGRFWYSCRENEKIESTYKIDIVKSSSFPKHFVNNMGDVEDDENKIIVLDTYDATVKIKDKSERFKTNTFYYIIKQENSNEN